MPVLLFVLIWVVIFALSSFSFLVLVTFALILAAGEKTEEITVDGKKKKKVVKRPWQATKIPTGNTVVIVRGDHLKRVWPNVGGHRMSDEEDFEGRRWLIKASEPDPKKVSNKKDRDRMVREEINNSFFYGTWRLTRWYQILLWDWFGIRFVSWFYPQIKIHTFEISRIRIKEGHEMSSDDHLKNRIEESDEDPVVHSLLFTVPRPIYVEGVELAGDNSRVNLFLLAVFHQVIPTLPIFYYKGNFFPYLDAAIEAGLVNFGASHRVAVWKDGNSKEKPKGEFARDTYDPPSRPKRKRGEKDEDYKKREEEWGKEKKDYEKDLEPAPLTLAHWLRLDRAAVIENHLRRINVTHGYYTRLRGVSAELKRVRGFESELFRHLRDHLLDGAPPLDPKEITDEITRKKLEKQIGHGIVPRFGFALVSLRLQAWTAHKDSKNLDEAIRAVEVSTQEAEVARRQARGQRDADILIAKGHAALYGNPVEALTKLGVTPDVAAQVFQTDKRTGNIGGKDSKVVTYIESGSGASVMVPAQSPPQTPPAPPAPPSSP